MRILAHVGVGVVMTGLLAACQTEERSGPLRELYYIPIGAYTFVPVTRQSIGDSSGYLLKERYSWRIAKSLLEALERAEPGEFEEQMVRAKIVTGEGAVYFLDNYGGVYDSGSTRKLSEADTRRVKSLLDRLTQFEREYGFSPQ